MAEQPVWPSGGHADQYHAGRSDLHPVFDHADDHANVVTGPVWVP
jgi:hypothetical protein